MIPDYNYYRDFTEDDFLTDPHFQDWVNAPTDDSNKYWQQFLVLFPGKNEPVDNARQLLVRLKFSQRFPSDALIQQKYLEYQQQIGLLDSQGTGFRTPPEILSTSERDLTTTKYQNPQSTKQDRSENYDPETAVPQKHSARIIKLSGWRNLLRVAAALSGILLVSYLIIQITNAGTTKTWSTAYGEIKTFYLPDSTLVVLNSKSELRISHWKNDEPREAWLDGEAFFDVKHINQKDGNATTSHQTDAVGNKHRLPFTVHTTQLGVEVLGTAFDIRERRGLTEVVLQRGSINCVIPGNKNQLMQPGERIVYEASTKNMTRNNVDANDYLQWRGKKLLLTDPTAADICRYLEDNFGKKILFQDSILQNKKIEGPILINNLDDALFVISTVLDAKIEKRDSIVIIKQNKRSL